MLQSEAHELRRAAQQPRVDVESIQITITIAWVIDSPPSPAADPGCTLEAIAGQVALHGGTRAAMAERAGQPEFGCDEAAEASTVLREVVVAARLSHSPDGERWTASDGEGRALVVWRLPVADDEHRRCRAAAAAQLARVRHPNLVPVLAAGEREGDVWVVSELDTGCALRRVLAVAIPTPEQAAHIVAGVLSGLHALHERGLWHGALDDASVSIGSAGEVRLGGWGLPLDDLDPDACRRADRRAAVGLLADLRRMGLRRRLRRERADARHDAAGDEGEQIATLERARETAEAMLEGRAGRRAAAELAALTSRLQPGLPPLRAPAPPAQAAPPGTAREHPHALRSHDAVFTPPPGPLRRHAAVLTVLLAVAAAAAFAVASGQVRAPLAVSLPRLAPSASPTPAKAVTAPTPRPAPAPARPVPALAPAAAGPITAVEIQPLAGSCQLNASCPVQVTVRLQPQPSAQQVRWSFRAFDRCTGMTSVLPGATVTALAGWAYVTGASRPTLHAAGGHPLGLVAVTDSPAAAASPAVLAGGAGPC